MPKLCEFKNCRLRTTYGMSCNPISCIKHKTDFMKLSSLICKFNNCQKTSKFNYNNETKPLYCSEHKMPNMVDIKSKKCKFENCKKRPSFNYQNEKSPIYCSDHKLINMIDVISKNVNLKTVIKVLHSIILEKLHYIVLNIS